MPFKIGPERSHDVCGSSDLHEIGLGQKYIKGLSIHSKSLFIEDPLILEYWSDGAMEYWSIGVLEYWSTGVLEQKMESFS
jgi:hypothetical protein